ncbi:zinc finger protein 64-like [Harmonia axyridis]|uniref:zinc finger protein 64-like n=1 Tax=Harmonia axyridis TaxID=115357 RepID=UPI001E277115|nr:zinc finger protein 64-like [Harmonia axyridis]
MEEKEEKIMYLPSDCDQISEDNKEAIEIQEVKTEVLDIVEEFIDVNQVLKKEDCIQKIENDVEFDYSSGENIFLLPKKEENIEDVKNCEYTLEEVIRKKPVHLNLRKYNCHHCDYSSKREYFLKLHIRNVHSDVKHNLIKYNCHYCDYSSDREYYLKLHIGNFHSDVKHNFDTNYKSHLDSVDSISKKHKCNLCHYTSNTKRTLRKHLNSVHINLKKYDCHLCDYSSHKKQILKVHIGNVHFDVKQQSVNYVILLPVKDQNSEQI